MSHAHPDQSPGAPARDHGRVRTLARTLAVALAGALVLALAPAAHADTHEHDGAVHTQVVGGADVHTATPRWMVAILERGTGGSPYQRQFCGGSAVTEEWILTASHCVVHDDGTPVAADRLGIAHGAADLLDPALVRAPVLEVRVHPDVQACGRIDIPCRAPADVALLRVEPQEGLEPLTLAHPHQVDLRDPGRAGEVLGWGAVDAGATSYPSVLQRAAATVVDPGRCYEDYSDAQRPAFFSVGSLLCAASPDAAAPAGACSGDSGGPLVVVPEVRPHQIGVVSVGSTVCGERPTLYAPIHRVRPWIVSVTGIVGFTDLVGTPHADAIIAIAEAGVASGRADGSFGPNRPLSRGQMATFLARGLQLPTVAVPFDDVPADHPHAEGIGAVVAAEITNGRADGTFGPDAPVNRGQMATFLTRALDLPTASADFDDVDADHPHADAIGAMAEAGITTGRGDGTFGPALPITRGQLASFLVRATGMSGA